MSGAPGSAEGRRELRFDTAPDLRRIYASALVAGRASSGPLPDVLAVRLEVRADADTVADYARVCGFPVRSTLPLTYPHVLAFPLQTAIMSQREFPLALMGSLHVENVITATRPIGLDEAFDLTVHAENLRPHRRGRQVDLVSEATVAGETVWRGVSTYLSRGEDHPDATTSEPPDLQPLQAVAAGPTWRFAEDVGRRYARVSGDWNPIHVHALTARPLGFPTSIAHGMYSYARVVAALGPRIPDAGVTSHVWFRKPLRLPSTVRLRSEFEANRALSLLSSAKADVQHAIIEHRW